MLEKITKPAAVVLSSLTGIGLLAGNAYALFPDVTPGNIYYEAIVWAEAEGKVEGYSDGNFLPDREVSRNEFVSMLIREAYSSSEIDACTEAYYPDVDSESPHYNEICVATREEIVHGYSDGEFKPETRLTAEQAAKVVINLYGEDFGQNEDTELSVFVERAEDENAWPPTVTDPEEDIERDEATYMMFMIDADSTASVVLMSAEHETLRDLLIEAELIAELSQDTEYTLFAPDDAAFDAVDDATLDSLRENQTELRSVLEYHIVIGEYTAAELMAMDGMTLETVQGEELTVEIRDGNVYIVDQGSNEAQVTAADSQAANGVVHRINIVLMP